jgi:opacity protein-like surface antigen
VIRAEYLYVRFNDYTAFTNPSVVVGSGGFPIALSTKLDDHIVRFGLAYKFGNFAYAAH